MGLWGEPMKRNEGISKIYFKPEKWNSVDGHLFHSDPLTVKGEKFKVEYVGGGKEPASTNANFVLHGTTKQYYAKHYGPYVLEILDADGNEPFPDIWLSNDNFELHELKKVDN